MPATSGAAASAPERLVIVAAGVALDAGAVGRQHAERRRSFGRGRSQDVDAGPVAGSADPIPKIGYADGEHAVERGKVERRSRAVVDGVVRRADDDQRAAAAAALRGRGFERRAQRRVGRRRMRARIAPAQVDDVGALRYGVAHGVRRGHADRFVDAVDGDRQQAALDKCRSRGSVVAVPLPPATAVPCRSVTSCGAAVRARPALKSRPAAAYSCQVRGSHAVDEHAITISGGRGDRHASGASTSASTGRRRTGVERPLLREQWIVRHVTERLRRLRRGARREHDSGGQVPSAPQDRAHRDALGLDAANHDNVAAERQVTTGWGRRSRAALLSPGSRTSRVSYRVVER
jgi:hypothetical protein